MSDFCLKCFIFLDVLQYIRRILIMKKKHRALKIVFICVGGFLALVLTLVGGFLIFATATTLQVKDVEDMAINGNVASKVDKSQDMKLLTWNVGYGALDEKQDCYWDGGKGVTG